MVSGRAAEAMDGGCEVVWRAGGRWALWVALKEVWRCWCRRWRNPADMGVHSQRMCWCCKPTQGPGLEQAGLTGGLAVRDRQQRPEDTRGINRNRSEGVEGKARGEWSEGGRWNGIGWDAVARKACKCRTKIGLGVPGLEIHIRGSGPRKGVAAVNYEWSRRSSPG